MKNKKQNSEPDGKTGRFNDYHASIKPVNEFGLLRIKARELKGHRKK
jgi:hypothetical protein